MDFGMLLNQIFLFGPTDLHNGKDLQITIYKIF